MYPVPVYEKFKHARGYTKTEMSILVAAIYITTTLFICQLIFSCYNIWNFLIR